MTADDLTPEQQAEQQAEQQQRARRLDEDAWRALLSERWGRRIVWQQLAACGVYRTTFTGEPLSSAFQEGQRSIGLSILSSVMDVAPAALPLMQAEAGDDEK